MAKLTLITVKPELIACRICRNERLKNVETSGTSAVDNDTVRKARPWIALQERAHFTQGYWIANEQQIMSLEHEKKK